MSNGATTRACSNPTAVNRGSANISACWSPMPSSRSQSAHADAATSNGAAETASPRRTRRSEPQRCSIAELTVADLASCASPPAALPAGPVLDRDGMPRRHGGVHLHPAEAAAVEHERLAAGVGDPGDPPEHEVVVAGADCLLHLAVLGGR